MVTTINMSVNMATILAGDWSGESAAAFMIVSVKLHSLKTIEITQLIVSCGEALISIVTDLRYVIIYLILHIDKIKCINVKKFHTFQFN